MTSDKISIARWVFLVLGLLACLGAKFYEENSLVALGFAFFLVSIYLHFIYAKYCPKCGKHNSSWSRAYVREDIYHLGDKEFLQKVMMVRCSHCSEVFHEPRLGS